MRPFIKFNKGLMRMPIHWQLWLLLLVVFNLIIPLFFLDLLEARVVVGALLACTGPAILDTAVAQHNLP